MLYLKWTQPGRVPSYKGGDPLPEPGRWTPTVRNPKLCERGWHACRWEDVAWHISDELWVCELAGKIVEGPNKVAAGRLRLMRRVEITDAQWRHFAAHCAGRVSWPRLAIQAARNFTDGTITDQVAEAVYAAADAATCAAYAAYATADAATRADAARAATRSTRAAQSGDLLTRIGLDPADFAHWT